MIFHEKLKLKFDIPALVAGMDILHELGDPAANGNFGGWAIQSDNGDWRQGFELTPDAHKFYKRTEACVGIWSDVLDTLEDAGLHPHRSRVTAIEPNEILRWHRDSEPDDYCIRLHLPIITNPDCAFEVQNEGAVHMPADGHAYVVDASNTHRAYNKGTTTRYHFLAQVWDTEGCTENFVLSESRKSNISYQQLKGYQIYLRVLDEKAKSG